jgi:uncharacterized membrane protein
MSKKGVNYFMERLSEPSTWRGILAVLTACGIAFSPDQADKIVAGGLALIGLVGAFSSDKKKNI